MNSDVADATTRTRGYPILHILVAFPIACFTGALATDITYMQSADIVWADFSAWLLAVGLLGAVLAAILGLLSLLTRRRDPTARPLWPILLGSLLVLAIAFLNNLVHSRDGWTAVMPQGLILSAVTVVIMLVTAWLAFTPNPRRVTGRYAGVSR